MCAPERTSAKVIKSEAVLVGGYRSIQLTDTNTTKSMLFDSTMMFLFLLFSVVMLFTIIILRLLDQ